MLTWTHELGDLLQLIAGDLDVADLEDLGQELRRLVVKVRDNEVLLTFDSASGVQIIGILTVGL